MPTPPRRMSILPDVWYQISGPVVSLWQSYSKIEQDTIEVSNTMVGIFVVIAIAINICIYYSSRSSKTK